MRLTKQRAAILKLLRDCEHHPTADWIYAQVRRELPQISLGTVYRLLNTLADEGVIRVLPLDDGPNHYDGNPGAHHHVVCTGCGRVTDVPELIAASASSEIERWTGYAVNRVRLDWYGLCPDCRAAAPLLNDAGRD